MPVYLQHIETAVPETSYTQEQASTFMQEHVTDRRAVRRILRSLYRGSGIEKRHSVMGGWNGEEGDALFLAPDGSGLVSPGTEARNEIYTREARRLFEEVASTVVEGTPGFDPEDVTHVVTISCTGFFAPGPDYYVVRALGLPGSTQRYHIGFMGCYAAFQGMKLADTICRSDPEAVVLVLSVELCSIHLQFSDNTDDLIAGSLFADGAAGVLVSARPPTAPARTLECVAFHSELAPEGEEDMAWTIGDRGFRMRLSTYVPDLLERNLGPVLERVLREAGVERDEVDWWGVHPGGRAILDRIQGSAELRDDQIAASRQVLRDYGNMSSATVLFVLDALMRAPDVADGDRILAMAFGPGLTIETGLFRVHHPS
ncbi:MAG: type III polyketide synthase [Gemmatimonadota bacterium]